MYITKGDVAGQLERVRKPQNGEYFTVSEATKLLAMYGITDKEATVRGWCSQENKKSKKRINALPFEGGKRQEGFKIPAAELEKFIKEWLIYEDSSSITKQYLDIILDYEAQIKALKSQLKAEEEEKEAEIQYILENYVAKAKREKYLKEKDNKQEKSLDESESGRVEGNENLEAQKV